MHLYLPDLAARSVPRYTSYPTAAEFHDGVGRAEQAAAVAALGPDAQVSLYVHIPYCRQICWYCGCNTQALGKASRLSAYVEALDREMAAVAARFAGRVIAVHFGGGSPNSLPAADFAALLARIRALFRLTPGAEIAVELDPRALDEAYVGMLAAAGVTRVSLGVQTFAPEVQRRINRLQPLKHIEAAVGWLRAAGIDAINFDLMYGLPGQTRWDVADAVSVALRLRPARIALFGYAHMPALLPRQRMIDGDSLPDAGERFEQSMLAHDLFVQGGYAAIGFDHFALPDDPLALASEGGRLRRNFQGFTEAPGDAVIGLGASAISDFPGLLVQNEKHVGRYRLLAANTGLAGARGVEKGPEDRLRAEIIERLLCAGSADVAAIAKAHGTCPGRFAAAFSALRDLAEQGIVTLDGWTCTITPAGRPYARLAAAPFDTYRASQPKRFSQAV